MRPFRLSGKTTSRAGAGSRSHRYGRKTGGFSPLSRSAWLILFSVADEPRNLISTDERGARVRQGRVVPDGSPRHGKDRTASQEGSQKNPGGGVCPFRHLAMGCRCNCAPQTRSTNLLRDHNWRSCHRRRDHHVRHYAVRPGLATPWRGTRPDLNDKPVIQVHGQLNRFDRGKPLGTRRPAAPRAPSHASRLVSVRVRFSPWRHVSPSASRNTLASASPPAL
jgi:hypothetical protein